MAPHFYLRIVALLLMIWPWGPARALVGAGTTHPVQARAPATDARIMRAAGEAKRLVEAAAAIPGSFPSVALIVATPDEIPLIYVRGTTRAGDSNMVDANSAIYIGSQTKSFIGLMAARLDRKNILPLDITLHDVWPTMKLPGNVRPEEVSLRDLLSHQAPLRTDTLNFLTAYVRPIAAREYPKMLLSYTKEREPGFSYSNLGYLIYAAALETRTGRSWKEWLRSEILMPLRLKRTDARSTKYGVRNVVWNHQWDGAKWIAYAPKSDETMHAAGGLFSSPTDMARWMQLNLRRGEGLPGDWESAFRIAQTSVTAAELSDGEFVCDGYGLGWYSCSYRGEGILMHSGQYVGTRSITILIPARHVGLSFMASSDSMIEGLALDLIKGFIGTVAGKDGEDVRLGKAIAGYPARIASMTASRQSALRDAYLDSMWGGWTWNPSPAEEAKIAGTFHNERLGKLEVLTDAPGLWGRLGSYTFRLQPARNDLFAAWTTPIEPPSPLKYDKAADTITWRDSIFERSPLAASPQASGR